MHKDQLPRPVFSLLGIILLAAAFGGFAQGPSAASGLGGKVVDQTGAAVARARVSAVCGSGREISSLTGEDGRFSLAASGECTVRVSADGFRDASRTVNDTSLPLQFILEVEGASATVTVESEAAYQTLAISSAMKTNALLRDVPQSIAVVTNEQIADQMMTSIGDVLRYTPGVSVHQGENNRDQVIIRGQSSSADFYLNGVRDDVQYYRDIYNLERLETLKGPNAMIFGRGGGGGVINRVTKEAVIRAAARDIGPGRFVL